MNKSALSSNEINELNQILKKINLFLIKDLNPSISHSYNVANTFQLFRTYDQINQSYRRLCRFTQTFIREVDSCNIETVIKFQQDFSQLLNNLDTMFKYLRSEVEKKVKSFQQAKKKDPEAYCPSQSMICQSYKFIDSFFINAKKLNIEFEPINQKFISKGNKNDPNGKVFQQNLCDRDLIKGLQNIKSQVHFLYQSLYNSYQLATFLDLRSIWNEMMEIHRKFSDQTNLIFQNKSSCNEQTIGQFYQNGMKSVFDIQTLMSQMKSQLQKNHNLPKNSMQLILDAQGCQSETTEYIENIRNQFKILKNKYPNIKESNFQGFKKQPQFKKVQINLFFKELNEFLDYMNFQELLDISLAQYFSIHEEKQKLIQIQYQSDRVRVQIEVDIPQISIENFKDQMKRKLQKLIDFREFSGEKSGILKKMLNKFNDQYLLLQKKCGNIVLISKEAQIKQQFDFINKEINLHIKLQVKDFYLSQKSQLALSKKFLQKQLGLPQYHEIQVKYNMGSDIIITFFGRLGLINQLINSLQQFLNTFEGKILEYNLPLTEQQLSIIEKDQQLKKHIESNWNLTVKYNRNQTILAQITIQPHHSLGANLPEKQITFQTYFNFDSLRAKSIFIFQGKNEITNVKRSCIKSFKKIIQQVYSNDPLFNDFLAQRDQQRNCVYFYGNEKNPLDVVLESKDYKLLTDNHVFMYLPDTKTFRSKLLTMIQKLCQNQDLLKSQTKITFICKNNQDIQSILGFKEGKNSSKTQVQNRWFAIDTQKGKLHYSQSGNQKIQNAIKMKMNEVQLTNQDLNMQNATHSFDFNKRIMTHNFTGKKFPINVYPNKITFMLFGKEKEIPNSEFQKIPRILWTNQFQNCQLSVGFYHIDLKSKIQKNLFSLFQRKIDSQNIEKSVEAYEFSIQYDLKMTNLILEYAQQNWKHIKTAVSYIKQNLNKRLIEISQPLEKDFTLQLIRRFKSDAKQQNITIYQSNDKKSVIFKAYNEKNIKNFIKMLSLVEKLPPVQFPKQWQPQTQQIQTFIVPKNTIEFQNVQKSFTAGNIVELVRIQNKLVYKKFHDEKNCLRELNGGKQVKEMLLYHGTLRTDPKLIYEDKEESFNINYTSQSNLLGRGTYFAQRSQYSVGYSYTEDKNKRIYSMFYCQVLVGDSQKCVKQSNDYRDTEFKDPVNRIRYESMTAFLQGSNVFVVYKNRRAYPLYLIKYTLKY